jgi:hypothetical protein
MRDLGLILRVCKKRSINPQLVMPGLVPGIHVLVF